MSSNPIRLKFLFDKYLQGNLNRQELDEFWQLMSELDENDLVLQDLQHLWSNTGNIPAVSQEQLNQVFGRLHQRIDEYESTSTTRIIPSRRKTWYMAAAIFFIAFAGASLYLLFSKTPGSSTSLAITTLDTQLKTITLPDGTKVTLNKESKLEYPSAFDENAREVTLTGEAFFDVQHDASKPFIVRTGNFVTKVLGTAFNIRAYAKDSLLQVTVESGKVQVNSENDQQSLGILQTGDQLRVHKETTAKSIAKANVQEVMEWKKHDLFFNNNSFADASLIIKNHFHTELIFQHEALHNCRFTGDLTDKTLEETLDIICALTKSSWHRVDEQHIMIEGEGCK